VSFGPSAVALIAERSGGVPRLINLICDRALHRGHLARTSLIDSDIVRVAMIDLGLAEAVAPAIPAAIHDAPVPSFYPEVAAVQKMTVAPEPAAPVDSAEPKKDPEQIFFEEHDLIHADHAVALQAPAATSAAAAKEEAPPPAPAAPPDDGDRPLLFESRGTWTGQASALGRRRWRRRTRRLLLAMAAAAGVVVVLYAQNQWEQSVEVMTAAQTPSSPLDIPARVGRPQPAERKAAVAESQAQPALPAPLSSAGDGNYSIDVALFSSVARASRLAAELTAANYHVSIREIELPDRGRLFEVMVGPFSTHAGADAALARVRAMPGYQDARLAASNP
jgi:hypothetical protein